MTQEAHDLLQKAFVLGRLRCAFCSRETTQNGSVAAFEAYVPSGQRLTAPAHSHDHYEETIYGVSGVSREC